MEKERMKSAVLLCLLFLISAVAFSDEEKKTRVVYPKKTELDLDATQIEGELKSPGDFYFQVKPEEKMDSLVKRRKNFHRQMLRDVVFSK